MNTTTVVTSNTDPEMFHQVEHASKHLKETVDGAEEVLSEAAATTKSATDAAKKVGRLKRILYL